MASALAFVSVDFAYPDGRQVFGGVSFEVPQGGFVLVSGPSGAGKSTLLRLMNRLEEPTAGRILYRDKPLDAYAPQVLRREVGYVQQTPTVLDATVRDNLLLPFGFRVNAGLPRPDDAALRGGLDEFLLDGVRLDDNARTLSVGQRQRLCCLRTMLLAPRVLLMDEPTSALDAASRREVEDAAETACLAGVAVVLISHADYAPRRVAPLELRVGRGSCHLGPAIAQERAREVA
ncbi:MAG: ATP-binding cassette domain-containing protein [Desulfovibrionaceae bacterium]